jgi:hypothetical protein
MHQEHGWKPLPALLKIIWVLTLFKTVSAIFMVFAVYGMGFEIFGIKVFGLLAVNLAFFSNLVLPVILLIAMINRYRWAWLPGILYYLFMAVNEAFGFAFWDETHAEIMSKMAWLYQKLGTDQSDYNKVIDLSIASSLILGSLVFLAIVIILVIKRKYFTHVKQDTDPQIEQGS